MGEAVTSSCLCTESVTTQMCNSTPSLHFSSHFSLRWIHFYISSLREINIIKLQNLKDYFILLNWWIASYFNDLIYGQSVHVCSRGVPSIFSQTSNSNPLNIRLICIMLLKYNLRKLIGISISLSSHCSRIVLKFYLKQ